MFVASGMVVCWVIFVGGTSTRNHILGAPFTPTGWSGLLFRGQWDLENSVNLWTQYALFGEVKVAGSTMCSRRKCVVIYKVCKPTVGVGSKKKKKHSSRLLLICKVKMVGNTKQTKTPLFLYVYASSCLQDQPQDYLHELMLMH